MSVAMWVVTPSIRLEGMAARAIQVRRALQRGAGEASTGVSATGTATLARATSTATATMTAMKPT